MPNKICEKCKNPLEGTYFRFCEDCLMENLPRICIFQSVEYKHYKQILQSKCHVIRKQIGDN